MLANFARLVPRMSRSLRTSRSLAGKAQDTQDIESVQRVEDELFGRYYGATDSSNIKKGFRGDSQKYRRRTGPTIKQTQVIKEEVPSPTDPWGTIKLPLHDPRVGRFILDARNPKRSKKPPRMIVEGVRLVIDALQTGIVPQTLLITGEDQLRKLETYQEELLAKSCAIYRVAPKDVSTWSSLTTPPGIMAIFERPEDVLPPKNCLPITVICDNIREPNNLGSICRVSAALPCRQVMVMKGCADPWESKSLRGGCGGQFHIPIEYPVNWEDLGGVANGSQVLLADNKPAGHRSIAVHTIDEKLVGSLGGDLQERNIFLVIGGETHGISAEAYQFAKSCNNGSVVNIPMADPVESMNTASALAVILFELRRQLQSEIP